MYLVWRANFRKLFQDPEIRILQISQHALELMSLYEDQDNKLDTIKGCYEAERALPKLCFVEDGSWEIDLMFPLHFKKCYVS